MDTIQSWLSGFNWAQALDLLFVIFIAYELYKLVKGTSALNIVLSIIGIYIFWKISLALSMPLTSEILDRVVSMGFLALVVIFQPEIRRFLFMLSTPGALKKNKKTLLFHRLFIKTSSKQSLEVTKIVQACMHLSQTKTGGLIILTQQNRLPSIISTGEKIDALISSALIENIFFKNSPLHDGALIIENNKIVAARCILPVTSNKELSDKLGLRHRSAIGATEQSDAMAIVVSEETGAISYSLFGNITYDVSPAQLRAQIEEFFVENKDKE